MIQAKDRTAANTFAGLDVLLSTYILYCLGDSELYFVDEDMTACQISVISLVHKKFGGGMYL